MPDCAGDGKPGLTLQEKIIKAKGAVKAAGFMVHPRYQPKGDGVQVYALIPIPVMDLELSDKQLADQVRSWIKSRCEPQVVLPVGYDAGKPRPADLRTAIGRKWKREQAVAT